MKGKLFMRQGAWVALLAKIQGEKPSAEIVTQLAYLTLAFAMLQPGDRYNLGEAFLTVFPEYKLKMLGA